MTQQIGGSHYAAMGIQPRVLAMANQWDCDAFSCLKYLSRYELKNGVEDLKKAKHFAEMRQEFAPSALAVPAKYPMSDYISENGFSSNKMLSLALRALWDTVYIHDGVRLYSAHLCNRIDLLIATYDMENQIK